MTTSTLSIPPTETPVQSAAPPTFEQLYAEYYPRTLHYVRGYRWDTETTEDLMQVIFTKVWRGLPALRPNAYYAGWIARIAHNVCVSEYRYRRRQRTCPADPLTSWHETSVASSLDDLSDVERRECAGSALTHLSVCDVYLLYQIARGYTPREVAAQLHISHRACVSRIWRARRVLHTATQEQERAS
jgi:RNA polymerase sigma factor (sigma-70 family)